MAYFTGFLNDSWKMRKLLLNHPQIWRDTMITPIHQSTDSVEFIKHWDYYRVHLLTESQHIFIGSIHTLDTSLSDFLPNPELEFIPLWIMEEITKFAHGKE